MRRAVPGSAAAPAAAARLATVAGPVGTRDTAGRSFFPAIEGLRAVAALLVVAVHVSFVSGLTTASGATGAFTARAEVGVGVFFVISGFLLYRPFAAAHLEGGSAPPLGRFLVRRAFRVLPLYWVVLAVTLWLVPSSRPRDLVDALLLPLLGQVYRGQTVYLGVPQAWSLCIEVVFYVALPGYAWLVGRACRSGAASTRLTREQGEWAAVGLLYATGLGFRWLFEATSVVPWKVWHGFLPVWFDLFALGFALALLSVRWRRGSGPPPFLCSTAGAVACWAAAGTVYVVLALGVGLGRNPLDQRATGQAVVEEVLWGLIAVLLALPAVAGAPRWLTVRPVALLGLVSYGIYLWHQGVVAFLLAHTGWDLFHAPLASFGLVVLVLTVLLAALSYRGVERPGIRVGHGLRGPLSSSRALTVSGAGRRR